jgi:transcriptional regulator
MYVPRHFSQDDKSVAHDLIRSNVFATLLTELSGRPEATHVPVILDEQRGAFGSLRFHLARANPTSRVLADGPEILMVFVGPNTYISPDWYASDNAVPTWNYAAVHAYGTPRIMDDAALRCLLDDLSASRENRLPKTPWTTDKMPPDLVDKMCKAIVGFDLPITELQSKWKFNQNRASEDRAGVIAALDELGDDTNAAVAETMRELDR